MPDNETVKRLKARLDALELERVPHERRMQEAIDYVLPYHYTMQNDRDDQNDWEDLRFDSTATEAASSLGDGMMGNLCPPTTMWAGYRAARNEDNDSKIVREWLQEVNERVFEAINRSNFYDLSPTVFKQAVALETVTVLIDEDSADGRPVMSIIPPREVYVINDYYGRQKAIFRRYRITAEQAADKWPDKIEEFTIQLQNAIEKNPDELFEFVSVAQRKGSRDEGNGNPEMPWIGYSFEYSGDGGMVDESNFYSNPMPTWRWEVRGRDPYGYGLTTEAMPDIKTLNEMSRTLIVLSQKMADPPTFLPNSLADDSELSLDAGALNFFQDGMDKPYAYMGAGSFPVTDAVVTRWQEKVWRLYKVRYFQMLMQLEQPGRTAYEIRERKIEKVTAMGSIVGRAQEEFLGPVLARFFWIEYLAGRIPEAPPEMMEGGLMVDYIGPFAQAQKEVTQTADVMTGLQNVMPVFEVFPEAKAKLRPAKIINKLLEASGFPEEAIVGDEEYEKILQAQAEAAQQAAMAEQAKSLGQSTKAFTERPTDGSIADMVMGTGR